MTTCLNNQDAYRFERKFHLCGISKQEVESIVRLHSAMFREVFNERLVNNIYFDSSDYRNYAASNDGLKTRSKVRIRWYGEMFDFIETPVLEFKIKKALLGVKHSFPIPSFCLDQGFSSGNIKSLLCNASLPWIYLFELSSMNPTLLNSYKRKYFQTADRQFRLTIDSEQTYYGIQDNNNLFLNKERDLQTVIMELKYNILAENDAADIIARFPFRVTKSSKYVTGIERLYKTR